MKYLSKGLLYHGISEHLSSKAIYMEECMKIPKLQEQVAKYLAENEELREKLECTEIPLKKGRVVQLSLNEDDLDVIFDEICGKKLARCAAGNDEDVKFYVSPMLDNVKELICDITGYVICSIVVQEECRKKLEEKIGNRGEYYGFWEEKKEKYDLFEESLPVHYIWDFRLLAGMMEKLKREEYRSETYRMLMEIIYAGYGYIKRELKGKDYLKMCDFREILLRERQEINSVFPMMCKLVLLMVVAEDMNIPIVIDYDMLVMLQFYEETEEENKKAKEKICSQESSQAKELTEEWGFVKEFEELYKTHNSLTEFAFSSSEGALGEVFFEILQMFGHNPRKFMEDDLTDEECRQILEKGERWSKKKYGYMLVIAVLCKYIHKLENSFLKISKEGKELYEWDKQKESLKLKKMEEECNRITDFIQEGKKQLEEVVRVQEQKIVKLQEQLDVYEARHQEDMQEISSLRNYTYTIGEKGGAFMENEESDDKNIFEFWKKKKVLVVGGHIHWQNKLRDKFPEWHFLTAGQSPLLSDVIKGMEIIVCNTSILDHACYYKLIAEKDRTQKLLYTCSNNIHRCLSELHAQMA